MHLIAHRGISAHFTENTLQAYQEALNYNVLGIEVDLHQIENEFALFHDFELSRLTHKQGKINQLTITELQSTVLKNGMSIPLLSDLFELVQGKCLLNLELKYIADPGLLAEQLHHYINVYNGDVVLSSFNHVLVKQVQHELRSVGLAHKVKTGALIAHLPYDMCNYAINLGVDLAIIDAAVVNITFVEHAFTHNLEVWCYTVNTLEDAENLKEMGVSAVFTNDPALLGAKPI
ncbi:MAG: glycerophosphodiester phosphodiesterase [Glaciecola sp.]